MDPSRNLFFWLFSLSLAFNIFISGKLLRQINDGSPQGDVTARGDRLIPDSDPVPDMAPARQLRPGGTDQGPYLLADRYGDFFSFEVYSSETFFIDFRPSSPQPESAWRELISVESLGSGGVQILPVEKDSRSGSSSTLRVHHESTETQFRIRYLRDAPGNPQWEDRVIDVSSSLRISRPEVYQYDPGTVHFSVNYPVNPMEAGSFIRFEPEVKFSIGRSGESELLLEGDFEEETVYTVSLGSGLPTTRGFTLDSGLTYLFKTPPAPPRLDFLTSGPYFPVTQDKVIPILLEKVDAVDVQVTRVHDQNILHFLKNTYSEDEFGEVVKSWSFKTGKDYTATEPYMLDMGSHVAGMAPGVYKIRVHQAKADEQTSRHDSYFYPPEDSRVIIISDLGLQVTRHGEGGTWRVWVTSLSSRKPVSGVSVSLYSYQFDKIVSGLTGGDGLADLQIPPGRAGVSAHALAAELDGDRNMVILDDGSLISLPGHEYVQGRGPVKAAYDAFVYSERDLYRPGDSIQWGCIIRDAGGAAVPDGLPLGWALVSRSGSEPLARGVLHADTAGHAAGAIRIPESLPTGPYRIRIHTPGDSDDLWGERVVHVKFFEPRKIEARWVSVPSDSSADPSTTFSVSVQTDFLFGAPAPGLECTIRLRRLPMDWDGFTRDGFRFDNQLEDISGIHNTKLEGITDENGRMDIQFTLPQEWLEGGAFTLGLQCSIDDGTGNTMTLNDSCRVHPQPVAFGIRVAEAGSGRNTDSAPQSLALDWMATGVDATPVTLGESVEWVISRVEWERRLVATGSGILKWQYVRSLLDAASGRIEPGAALGRIDTSIQSPGLYCLRLFHPDSADGEFMVSEFHFGSESLPPSLAGGNGTDALSLPVTVPAGEFRSGAPVTLSVETPVGGSARVDIFCGNSLDTRVVRLDRGENSIEVGIPASRGGSAHAVVTLLSDPEQNREGLFPERIHGVAHIPLDTRSWHITASVHVPDVVRPGDTITIDTRLKSDSALSDTGVHLFAVDEGILAMSSYPLPDPHQWFHGRKALNAGFHDIFDHLYPDITRAQSLQGQSDTGGGSSGIFLSPYGRSLSELAIEDLGVFDVPADGHLQTEFTVPSLEGRLRIMAIAFGPESTGSAQAFMTVRSPVSLIAGVPAAVVPGDQFFLSGSLTSHLDEAVETRIRIQCDGLDPVESDEFTMNLEPGATRGFDIPLRAGGEFLGDGAVTVDLSAAGTRRTWTFHTAIRPSTVRESTSTRLVVRPGESIVEEIIAPYLPSTARIQLHVNDSELGEIHEALRFLRSYPYGCLEQSVSGAMPLLFTQAFAHPAEKIDLNHYRDELSKVVRNLEYRFWTGDGFRAWPDSRDDQPTWHTAGLYAAHFIAECDRKDIGMGRIFRRELIQWLDQQSGVNNIRTTANAEDAAYALYILGLFGEHRVPYVNALASDQAMNSLGRVFLAGALIESGERDAAYRMLRGMPVHDIYFDEERRDPLCTDIRAMGMALAVFAALDPDMPQAGQLRLLLNDRRSGHGDWETTIQNGAAALGYGRLLEVTGTPQAPKGTLALNGAQPVSFGSDSGYSQSIETHKATVSISNQGDTDLVLNVHFSGVPPVAPAADQGGTVPNPSGLVVRREYRHESRLPPEQWQTGDLIESIVILESPTAISSVAVVDLFPGCLEPDGVSAITATNFTIESTDTREDRQLVFGSINPSGRAFLVSRLRVNRRGDFAVPGVFVEAMYNPGLSAGFNPAGRLRPGAGVESSVPAGSGAPVPDA